MARSLSPFIRVRPPAVVVSLCITGIDPQGLIKVSDGVVVCRLYARKPTRGCRTPREGLGSAAPLPILVSRLAVQDARPTQQSHQHEHRQNTHDLANNEHSLFLQFSIADNVWRISK